MNPIQKFYCRIYQNVLHLALPFLPYRKPEILSSIFALPDLFHEKKISTVLLITDKSIRSFGLSFPLKQELKNQDIECIVYDDTVPNPTSDNVEEARKLYIDHHCEALIGFGGGSSIDCAKAVHDGNDLDARKNMLEAAFLAGNAFSQSYVGYVHAIAHSLGGQYNVPHGYANAVILPMILEAYGEHTTKKLAELAIVSGTSRAPDPVVRAKAFIQAIKEMKSVFSIPDTFKEIREEDIPMLAKQAAHEANPLYPVPKEMNAKELEQYYRKLMEDGHGN